MSNDNRIERLAAHCHDRQWSGWMRYLFSACLANEDGTMTIPAWAVERWQRQAATPYAELPEEERESDRKEATGILAVVFSTPRLAPPDCPLPGFVISQGKPTYRMVDEDAVNLLRQAEDYARGVMDGTAEWEDKAMLWQTIAAALVLMGVSQETTTTEPPKEGGA